MAEKVSVIIPAYNAELWIERCIQSVLHQSYQNFEILVINDGSKDKTGIYLDALQKTETRLHVTHQENHGVSFSRNIGLQKATGKYVVFVDADDTLKETYLAQLVCAVQNAELAVCGYLQTDSENHVLTQSFLKAGTENGAGIIEQMLRYRCITSALWNKIFLLDIIRTNGISFRSEYAIGEDMVFLTEYCLYVKCANIIPECLYCYTSNPQGAMLSGKTGTFQTKWRTEWNAVSQTEALLAKGKVQSNMIVIKKARIADKLLTMMRRTNYQDKKFQKELQLFLCRHISAVLKTKDFTLKKKISCMLNIIFTPHK